MNTIVVTINPANKQVTSIVGMLTNEVQLIIDANPTFYAVITSEQDINEIMDFARSVVSSGGAISEYSCYYEDERIVRKPNIVIVKTNKISALSSICAATCCAGVISDALGTDHFYGTQILDQQNITMNVMTSFNPLITEDWTVSVWCADVGNNHSWNLVEHNKDQIHILGEDLLRHIERQRGKLNNLKIQINNISDNPTTENVELLNNINW
jgi:hypothetical protein